MSEPLKLGVAGLGTVGAGLLQLLQTHKDRLEQAAGRPLQIVAVSARSRTKSRGVDLSEIRWFDDPAELAADPGIDVFVELIGGDDGVAKKAVEVALTSKKHVVTANKALLARHGVELARLAEKSGVALNFEAAVAGGIPVIKALREALVGNEIRRVYGILNGTCNYILTKMQAEKLAFADVLKDAQAKGYAEADPTFDIGGFDAAHKLTLLTSLAFGTRVAFDSVDIEGIQSITAADIDAAEDLGYRIKLLGVAQRTESGIEQRVHPAMVAQHSAIAEVNGVTNCVAIEGDFVGNLLLIGPGAGARPTASAVMSDLVDIARGLIVPSFIARTAKLAPFKKAKIDRHQGAYYVRLSVYDRVGTMAGIARRMAERKVSLEQIVQRRPRLSLPGIDARLAPGAPTPLILITHETTEVAIREALHAIVSDGHVHEKPQMIRIEKL